MESPNLRKMSAKQEETELQDKRRSTHARLLSLTLRSFENVTV